MHAPRHQPWPLLYIYMRTYPRETSAKGITKIKEAKYEKVFLDEVANKCIQLSSLQQQLSSQLLQHFPVLFSGQLGCYNEAQFSLQSKDARTIHIFCKPYPVAQIHMAVFRLNSNTSLI